MIPLSGFLPKCKGGRLPVCDNAKSSHQVVVVFFASGIKYVHDYLKIFKQLLLQLEFVSVTMPNLFIRIHPDGQILYILRWDNPLHSHIYDKVYRNTLRGITHAT